MTLKNNKIYRAIVIPICVILCFIGRIIPPFPGLTSDATSVILIFIGSLILWLTIGIDWPSLLCIFALLFLDNVTVNSIFASGFGDATLIFLMFTFVCTYALTKTSLIKRIAIGFINNKIARKSGYFFILFFLSAVLVLGLFISPTVLFIIILPILEEIFAVAQIKKGERIASILMMGLGFTVSLSSGMTTISHVFPVLAMSAAGISVSPIAYMGMAIPTGLLVFIVMYLIFIFFAKQDIDRLKNLDVSNLKNNLAPINKKDIITLVIFLSVVALWIVPSFFEGIWPQFYAFFNKYGTAMPPMLGAILLCVIHVDDQPLIKIDDALKNGIPWGSIMMCVATLTLGAVLTNDNVGLKAYLQTNIGASLSTSSVVVLLIVFTTWAALQTNLSSNMVTATLVATVAASILASNSALINFNAVICLIGMLASFAFATPPAMPHIAIVAGSEYSSTKDVLVFGSILTVVSIIFACLVGYPLGTLLM